MAIISNLLQKSPPWPKLWPASSSLKYAKSMVSIQSLRNIGQECLKPIFMGLVHKLNLAKFIQYMSYCMDWCFQAGTMQVWLSPNGVGISFFFMISKALKGVFQKYKAPKGKNTNGQPITNSLKTRVRS